MERLGQQRWHAHAAQRERNEPRAPTRSRVKRERGRRCVQVGLLGRCQIGTPSRLQVYDMALYTPRRVHTTSALLALPGPKQLQFEALLELTGTDLGQLLIRGMQANCSPAQMSRHTPSTTQLIEIFSARSRLLRGESFAMAYIPGKGTQFYIAGQAQGDPVGDAEFFDMILRTWFGPASVDPQLRDQLLGRKLKP